MFPTAIGLMPPHFLFSANKLAEKNSGLIDSGTLPDRTKFMKLVRVFRKISLDPPLLLAVKSFKICGHRRSGPPAEPAGKLPMRFSTVLGVTIGGTCRSPMGGGVLESVGAGGCLARSLLNVVSSLGARLSSEDRILTAPFTSPASILFATICPMFKSFSSLGGPAD